MVKNVNGCKTLEISWWLQLSKRLCFRHVANFVDKIFKLEHLPIFFRYDICKNPPKKQKS